MVGSAVAQHISYKICHSCAAYETENIFNMTKKQSNRQDSEQYYVTDQNVDFHQTYFQFFINLLKNNGYVTSKTFVICYDCIMMEYFVSHFQELFDQYTKNNHVATLH